MKRKLAIEAIEPEAGEITSKWAAGSEE